MASPTSDMSFYDLKSRHEAKVKSCHHLTTQSSKEKNSYKRTILIRLAFHEARIQLGLRESICLQSSIFCVTSRNLVVKPSIC